MKLLVGLFALLASAVFAQSPTLTIRNAFQSEAMTRGQEIPIEEVTIAAGETYDGIIFDITLNDKILNMSYNVSERAQMDPTGVIAPGNFERYYIRFEDTSLSEVSVSSNSVLVPTVKLLSEHEFLIEFSEGMVLGEGNNVSIDLVFAEAERTK